MENIIFLIPVLVHIKKILVQFWFSLWENVFGSTLNWGLRVPKWLGWQTLGSYDDPVGQWSKSVREMGGNILKKKSKSLMYCYFSYNLHIVRQNINRCTHKLHIWQDWNHVFLLLFLFFLLKDAPFWDGIERLKQGVINV